MRICDAKGRGCIEKNSPKTFDCNTTCVGIYADVHWIGKEIEEEFKDEKADENVLEGKIDDDIQKRFLLLERKLELMKNSLETVKKIATEERGEELDEVKYKMLVSEYRKFKAKNVRHFRFNAGANLQTFGE